MVRYQTRHEVHFGLLMPLLPLRNHPSLPPASCSIFIMENNQEIVKQNTKRANRAVKRKAAEMSQSAEHIRSIRAKLSHETQQLAALAKQQKQFRLIASLSTKGVTAWVQLNEQNNWKKEDLLAVFCCSKTNAPFRRTCRNGCGAPAHRSQYSEIQVLYSLA